MPRRKLPNMLAGDSAELRKARGAFFTPYAIAEHLAAWALRGTGNQGVVLDPTCGEGVFLLAAGDQLRIAHRPGRLIGIDLHEASLAETGRLLDDGKSQAELQLLTGDFFDEQTPDQLGARLPFVDAVIGNPPFVRYQEHRGEVRNRAKAAALAQGVRLSGLASSWAALLVHASGFLKPDGRIAMVLPAELLSVGYAEPVRQWLKRRFSSVHLVLFERLQFQDATEGVVLLVARGTGGCNAFTLHHVSEAAELGDLHIYDADAFAPQDVGKWTDLLVPEAARGTLRRVSEHSFEPLGSLGSIELGTVTGANNYFTLSERTRVDYKLRAGVHVQPVVPPGTRHVRGLHFRLSDWEQLRLEGARVWLLHPTIGRPGSGGFADYLKLGEELKVPEAYKCTVRQPWWQPPAVSPPDMFFTYMSHHSPRLITNEAGYTFVNSMHGLTFRPDVAETVRAALPLIALNTVTMLGAEVQGRAYGGGILKMEPREAAQLPLPQEHVMTAAWPLIASRQAQLEDLARRGDWDAVTLVVDEAVFAQLPDVTTADRQTLHSALQRLRQRRQGTGTGVG